MRNYLILITLIFLGLNLNAQSKKQIKELDIKSTTVWEYDYTSGKEQKKVESVEKFNNIGEVIESIDYDKNGKQKEKIVYKYNEDNEIVEEVYYDHNDKIDKSYKYTYEGELRKTKEKFDHNGNLVWKKVYIYEM